MAEFLGPIQLARAQIEARLPAGGPGVYALGYARPQEDAVFISWVGRADGDLKERVLGHVGGRYTACFWLPTATPEEAWRAECELWHEMGGEELDSGLHPVPPADLPCPVCG